MPSRAKCKTMVGPGKKYKSMADCLSYGGKKMAKTQKAGTSAKEEQNMVQIDSSQQRVIGLVTCKHHALVFSQINATARAGRKPQECINMYTLPSYMSMKRCKNEKELDTKEKLLLCQ